MDFKFLQTLLNIKLIKKIITQMKLQKILYIVVVNIKMRILFDYTLHAFVSFAGFSYDNYKRVRNLTEHI